jgi:hypothetical protein
MNEETPEVLGPIVECILEREGIQGRLQVKKKQHRRVPWFYVDLAYNAFLVFVNN